MNMVYARLGDMVIKRKNGNFMQRHALRVLAPCAPRYSLKLVSVVSRLLTKTLCEGMRFTEPNAPRAPRYSKKLVSNVSSLLTES